jgi:hypothetical protein
MIMEGFCEQYGIIPNGLQSMLVLLNGLDEYVTDLMPVPKGHFYNSTGLPYARYNGQDLLLY